MTAFIVGGIISHTCYHATVNACHQKANSIIVSSRLVSTTAHLLRPLVRLLLSRGLTYPSLAEILKRVYTDVAIVESTLRVKRQTHSRLCLITGVHRKDLRRFGDSPLSLGDANAMSASLATRLLVRWQNDPDFLDSVGIPKPLPRQAQGDGTASFETLVAAESKDFRARVVLDDWLHRGVVLLDDKERVCLRADGLLPSEAFEMSYENFGRSVHDCLDAAVSSLMDEQRW
jgi:hypothetical protein